jgi:ParB/RepB/Spo0J family partition protein
VHIVGIDKLKPHPLNARIYGLDIDDSFVEAIKKNGIYQPLLVAYALDSGEYTVIAGHRRLEAARRNGIKEVPVTIFDSNDELTIRTALIEANNQRVKTNYQIGAEYNALVEVETERAKQRMATNTGGGQRRKNLAQAKDEGKTRDLIAKRIGKMSGVTVERAGKVVSAIEKFRNGSKGDMDHADELALELEKSIDAGWTSFQKLTHVVTGDANKDKTSPKTTSKRVASKAATSASEAHHVDSVANPTPDTEVSSKSRSTSSVVRSDDTDEATPPHESPDAHDTAYEHADAVVTFLRSPAANHLNDAQKKNWGKIVGQMVGLLEGMGIASTIPR